MIKLDSIELEKAKGDANSVAQALVKKAIEEEMKLRPFSDEELNALSDIKKNVEIEYFLNLVAQNKITVSDVEILEAYKENLSTFGDKNVTDIYPQLHQLVFNKKLGAEKAVIVNNLVSKYGLNDILKEYVPELKNLGKEEEEKTAFTTPVEEPVKTVVTEAPVQEEPVFEAVKNEEPVKEAFVAQEMVKEDIKVEIPEVTAPEVVPIVEELQVEPFVADEGPFVKEVFTEEFIVKEEPVVVEPTVQEETPKVENIIPEPFILNTDEISKQEGFPTVEEVVVKNDEIFSTPFASTEETTVQNNFVEETTNLFEAPQVVSESDKPTETGKKSELLEDNDSPNEPFAFGNFNFKFD